jgi:hypothetical protein
MEYPENLITFFKNLFVWKDFMPHGHRYLWRPEIVWTHVLEEGETPWLRNRKFYWWMTNPLSRILRRSHFYIFGR